MLATIGIFFLGLIVIPFSWLPNFKIPDQLISSGTWFIGLTRTLDLIFFGVVHIVWLGLFWIIMFELALWVLKGILNLWNWFRGAGGLNIN